MRAGAGSATKNGGSDGGGELGVGGVESGKKPHAPPPRRPPPPAALHPLPFGLVEALAGGGGLARPVAARGQAATRTPTSTGLHRGVRGAGVRMNLRKLVERAMRRERAATDRASVKCYSCTHSS